MKYYIGFGSNVGSGAENLNKALELLDDNSSIQVLRSSSLYRIPALLPKGAPAEWDQNFVNGVAEVSTDLEPAPLLTLLKEIETQCGRNLEDPKWAPRPVDLDILLCDAMKIKNDQLQVPHKEIMKRNFVLAPLRDLDCDLEIQAPTKVIDQARLRKAAPLVLDILNLSPDSFSGDGHIQEDLKTHFQKRAPFVGAFDIGAESTRPGAKEVFHEEEWSLLQPAMEVYDSAFPRNQFRPHLSVDTRHPATMKKALEMGANIINDVSGLGSPETLEILQSSQCNYILMHSLGVPAQSEVHLDTKTDPVFQILVWLEKKLNELSQAGVSLRRIYFDPGIGFGKTPEQNIQILQRINELQAFGLRILVGHSRKSFLTSFSDFAPAERDPETLGLAGLFARQGVDAMRLHQGAEFNRSLFAQDYLLRPPA